MKGRFRSWRAVAHSAPIYIVVDGQPFWKTAAVPDLVKEQRQYLQDLLAAPVDPIGDLEAWETLEVLAPQWERQRFLLRPRVEKAEAIYRDIEKRASSSTSSSARLEALGLAAAAAGCLFLVRRRRRYKAGY